MEFSVSFDIYGYYLGFMQQPKIFYTTLYDSELSTLPAHTLLGLICLAYLEKYYVFRPGDLTILNRKLLV
ncbi:hypothetical protein FNW02_01035 [Komarekiella sp. 'clone 1']|uniref:Uncharacterized protein n=1 Tax=Komarekiella delphini-convector SJRDD-AB1 TaxID=2593771 RepID=A0AA40VPW6_9NOST|nr:hypothetical protein [Komarekiella delphini-convector]MBD6614491.1 hypothetical protein [Komarekiella delphini-convector SJRDD-AB1]